MTKSGDENLTKEVTKLSKINESSVNNEIIKGNLEEIDRLKKEMEDLSGSELD